MCLNDKEPSLIKPSQTALGDSLRKASQKKHISNPPSWKGVPVEQKIFMDYMQYSQAFDTMFPAALSKSQE